MHSRLLRAQAAGKLHQAHTVTSHCSPSPAHCHLTLQPRKASRHRLTSAHPVPPNADAIYTGTLGSVFSAVAAWLAALIVAAAVWSLHRTWRPLWALVQAKPHDAAAGAPQHGGPAPAPGPLQHGPGSAGLQQYGLAAGSLQPGPYGSAPSALQQGSEVPLRYGPRSDSLQHAPPGPAPPQGAAGPAGALQHAPPVAAAAPQERSDAAPLQRPGPTSQAPGA